MCLCAFMYVYVYMTYTHVLCSMILCTLPASVYLDNKTKQLRINHRTTQAAKDVVLCEKPVITDDSSNLEPLLLNKLMGQVRTSVPMRCMH